MTKYSKNLKTNANFNKILLKFVILTSSEPLNSLQTLSSFPNSNLKEFHRLIKIYKSGTWYFSDNENSPFTKLLKLVLLKKDNQSITSINYALTDS